MKSIFLLLLSTSLLCTACASTSIGKNEEMKNTYNSELANKLGADDYGMRSYIFVTLLTGPKDKIITDKEQRAELFKGHFSNMESMAEKGQLVLAGPFIEDQNKRGLFILNVATIEEAKVLIQNDPTIAEGIFKVELTKYYGSAALMQVNELHKSIQKTSIN